ncbi:hypothetical protein ACFQZK_09545 [Rhodococcus aetherivorans]
MFDTRLSRRTFLTALGAVAVAPTTTHAAPRSPALRSGAGASPCSAAG